MSGGERGREAEGDRWQGCSNLGVRATEAVSPALYSNLKMGLFFHHFPPHVTDCEVQI